MMVIVRLEGGLGNQLFQYSVGRAVALRKRTTLKLDITAFAQYEDRSYRLDHFNVAASLATPEEVARLLRRGDERGWQRLWWAFGRRLERLLPEHRRGVFRQRLDRYDPDIRRVRRDVYLTGYWQSEKYFKDIEEVIRTDLTFREAPDAANREMLSRIEEANTGGSAVSLHIRRGDYVSNLKFSRKFGVCSLAYYHSAVARLAEGGARLQVSVFSDDIDWARDNLVLPHPLTFVGHNGPDKDYEDLRLMTHCRYHVMANSTFSWWGAWLCAHPDKIVIAPKRWFNEPGRDASDLVPEAWERM